MASFLSGENVGGLDLTVRAFVGTVAVIVLALDIVSGVTQWILALAAFVGLFTSLTRHCAPYALLGLSTAKKKCG